MAERAPRAKRWSRGRVRALAWVTGLATFLTGVGVLGAAPVPDQPARASNGLRSLKTRSEPQVVIRRITRRVVIVEPAIDAPVTYVSAPTTASSGSTGSAGASAPVAAPPAPPPTGGS